MSKDSAFKNFLHEKLQSVLSSYLKDFSFDLKMVPLFKLCSFG